MCCIVCYCMLYCMPNVGSASARSALESTRLAWVILDENFYLGRVCHIYVYIYIYIHTYVYTCICYTHIIHIYAVYTSPSPSRIYVYICIGREREREIWVLVSHRYDFAAVPVGVVEELQLRRWAATLPTCGALQCVCVYINIYICIAASRKYSQSHAASQPIVRS